jgi:hypothetical protein
MIKKYLYIAFWITCFSPALHAQKLYFNGLGRTQLTNSRILGNALTNDTASARKKTSGYILFDFGINYQPSDNFRASATIRLRNEFGGFYGTANKLSFRQFKLEGILAKAIKLGAGDLDLALTPYTLYNFDEIYHDYESEIFALRRRVTNYENFNFGNKWRVQGGQINSDLRFSKVMERIGIRAFLTNTGRQNYFNYPTLQSIMAGGRLDLVQSKFFKIGGNYTGIIDIRNESTENNYEDHVFTGDYKIGFNIDSLAISLYGEAGKSFFTNHNAGNNYERNGRFYEVNISGNIKPWSLNLYGSYRMVDENFASPGAQTRRIFDYNNPQLFTLTDNNTVIRSATLLDRYSDESIRNLYIQSTLMAFQPQYNNITPYGIATPNRQGFSFGFTKGQSDKAFMADARVDLLEEVKADTTASQRNFIGIKGGVLLNLHQLMKWEKLLSLNFGGRREDTRRDVGSIRLTSILWDAGINIEIFKKFDLLFGYKLLEANGNESGMSFSHFKDGVMASGLRYRFNRNTFFTAQGHWVKYLNMDKSNDYKINQLFLNFTMVF